VAGGAAGMRGLHVAAVAGGAAAAAGRNTGLQVRHRGVAEAAVATMGDIDGRVGGRPRIVTVVTGAGQGDQTGSHVIDATVSDRIGRVAVETVGRVGALGDGVDDRLPGAVMAGGAGAAAVGGDVMGDPFDLAPARHAVTVSATGAVGEIAGAQGHCMAVVAMNECIGRVAIEAVGRVGAQGDGVDDLLPAAVMAGGAGAGAVGGDVMGGAFDLAPARHAVAISATGAVGKIAGTQGYDMVVVTVSGRLRRVAVQAIGRGAQGDGVDDLLPGAVMAGGAGAVGGHFDLGPVRHAVAVAAAGSVREIARTQGYAMAVAVPVFRTVAAVRTGVTVVAGDPCRAAADGCRRALLEAAGLQVAEVSGRQVRGVMTLRTGGSTSMSTMLTRPGIDVLIRDGIARTASLGMTGETIAVDVERTAGPSRRVEAAVTADAGAGAAVEAGRSVVQRIEVGQQVHIGTAVMGRPVMADGTARAG